MRSKGFENPTPASGGQYSNLPGLIFYLKVVPLFKR